MAGHYRLDAVRAHLLEMAGDRRAAIEQYQAAAARTTSIPERNYLLTQAARLRDRLIVTATATVDRRLRPRLASIFRPRLIVFATCRSRGRRDPPRAAHRTSSGRAGCCSGRRQALGAMVRVRSVAGCDARLRGRCIEGAGGRAHASVGRSRPGERHHHRIDALSRHRSSNSIGWRSATPSTRRAASGLT